MPASAKILKRIADMLASVPEKIDEAAYRALRNRQPTYTNVESAATPIPYGSAEAAEKLVGPGRGVTSRDKFPGDPRLHEAAVRGTIADLGLPNVQPSVGSWTEAGVNYTNPASSVNLGRGLREFGGYGGPIPEELARTAGALQQTGAGLSRFTPSVLGRPKGYFRDVEYAVSPTEASMRRALESLTPAGDYMGDEIYGRFLQHIPQEGVVRGHAMSPHDVRILEQVFSAKPKYGRADTVYNEDYPLEAVHRARGLLD